MNVLYLGYWNLNDALTTATIYPSLRLLRELFPKATLVFVNIQREPLPTVIPDIFRELEILYHPILSGNTAINKINDFWLGATILKKLCLTHSIKKVIARGAPAGALSYLLWKRNKTPFLVESFEPHAEYMLESGVWGKFDLRYILQKRWEDKQKKNADGLMPVTQNYALKLIGEGVDQERIKVVPCVVDENLFGYSKLRGLEGRNRLSIDPYAIVGIYAGKYDGLYLAEESFKLYRILFDQISNFHLILLSPTAFHPWMNEQIVKYNLPSGRIFIKSVTHDDVGFYCSSSDFALATYKSGKSKAYLSPVKVGEYWANGLPVMLTKGVGDESLMIQNGFGGVLFDADCINAVSLTEKIETIVRLVKTADIRETISKVGLEVRSFEKLKIAYRYFLLER